MFGPLNVDLFSNSDTLRVEVTGADGKAFLAGTGIRKPKASDVGVDHEQLIQKPGTELVAVIGGEAIVVEVNDDTMIIQQRHFPVCPSVSKQTYCEYQQLKGLTARIASTKEYWVSAAM